MAKNLDRLLDELPAKRRAVIEARAGELTTLTRILHKLRAPSLVF